MTRQRQDRPRLRKGVQDAERPPLQPPEAGVALSRSLHTCELREAQERRQWGNFYSTPLRTAKFGVDAASKTPAGAPAQAAGSGYTQTLPQRRERVPKPYGYRRMNLLEVPDVLLRSETAFRRWQKLEASRGG